MSQNISFECAGCEKEDYVEYGEEETDDDGDLICTDCAEDSWEDQDFPLWIDVEHYEDNWEMLDRVGWATGLDTDDIPSDNMKYCVFSAWFKINEYGSINGPYDEKNGELIHN